MTDLRREAIGRKCQIRLEGCGTEPCCLCHFRLIGLSGLSMKVNDLIAAWGCHKCHVTVDTEKAATIQLAFAHAVFRTLTILFKEGIILIRGRDKE